MKRSATIFLQILIILLGVLALTFLLWEPQVEGRNVNATFFEIYFTDLFLAYAYVGSIPFFVGLYHAFKVLGYIGQNKVFSQVAVKSLRTIKWCAVAIISFVVVGEVILLFNESDDRAGPVMMGVVIIFASIVTATVAELFGRILEKAVDIKSENDLTV